MPLKFIFTIFILTIAFQFAFTQTALATSGACSGHSGVNCAAGADSDGSVICNDGWRNSSVGYSSMVMCQGYSKPVDNPTPVRVPTTTNTTSTTKSVSTTSIQTNEEEKEEINNSIVDETDQWENIGEPEEEPVTVPLEDQVEAEDQDTTPTESSPGDAVTGLGILGGIGYGIFRVGKKIINLFSK